MVRGRWGTQVIEGRTKREVIKTLERLVDEAIVDAFVSRNIPSTVEVDGVKRRIFVKAEVL
jgi:hypothetical protein